LIGSLRKESFSRKLANALPELSPESLALHTVEIGELPLYNIDLDDTGTPPTPWVTFRDQVRTSDGILFVTPEYNRSIPGLLKNAVDVGSRPWGKSVWNKKPAAIISQSSGGIGGFGANHHLRASFVHLNSPMMQQPEAYIGGADKLFDSAGKLTNDGTRKFLGTYMQAYAEWVERHLV
jgi:chromate reductase